MEKVRKYPYFLTTPVHKIRNNLNKSGNKPPVVLLTTGGFSPIHRGHLEMMEIAKREMESRGFAVVGGYISPSHDGYIPKIYQGIRFLKTPHCLALCELAVHASDWLMIDSWEARYNKIPILYQKVILHLGKYLSAHLKGYPDIKVIYVFGSDNADFIRSFIKNGICICVRRKNFETHLKKILNKYSTANNPNIIISQKITEDFSSSNVRLGESPGINKETDRLWKSLKQISAKKVLPIPTKKIYLFRNDIQWATRYWITNNNSDMIIKAVKKFTKGIIQAFDKAFKQRLSPDQFLECEFRLIEVNEQMKLVSDLERKKKLLNLDLITHSQYKIHLSRLYGISDGQCHVKILVNRPGYPEINKQLEKIPKKIDKYIDDDIASGETRDILFNLLPKQIQINEFISLLDQYFKAHQLKRNKLLDIVDMRDFLVGAKDAGLVVSLPNGKICRAPYILPYVSLVSRAKIPPSREVQLSIILWKLNAKFYKTLESPILLEETDPSFQTLMAYIGFSQKATMYDICDWHIKQLLNTTNHNFS